MMISPGKPRELKFDNDDSSVHSELGFEDEDLKRMSEDAMNLLHSISAEVDEMGDSPARGKNNGSKNGLTGTPEMTGSNTSSPSTANRVIPHINDVDIGDDYDDMSLSDESYSDSSFMKELSALRNVTKEIEKELNDPDSIEMREAVSSIMKHRGAPDGEDDESIVDHRKRLLGNDDKEIIQRILDDEMKNYEPKNGFEHFMKRYRLDGLSSGETTSLLATSCTVVWSIVLRLMWGVVNGEL